ncbi:MAG TPA: hypothetical protein VKB80_14705 [Kofleriaceae bacterium]|nr:hypothetical protein [Kofleriaceae bacterium]
MVQSRGIAAGSRWHEWIIVISIAALAAIGVASIWGGSIRRWINSSSDRPATTNPDQTRGSSGSRI